MSFSTLLARHLWIAALLATAACSDNTTQTADDVPVSTPTTQASSTSTTTTTTAEPTETSAEDPVPDEIISFVALPTRDGPRRETSGNVPHVQIGTEPVPEVDAEVSRRVYSLPGVEERESRLSLPGARSLWLADDLELARPEVLQSGREFGHIHPDGSFHLWLPVERANQVDEAKWGELHPWVDRENFWDGVVMIYIPETADDAEVALQLIVDAYNYIAGTDLDPADLD